MQTFKEYLIEDARYDNIVIEPNTGRGRGVAVYGYVRGNDEVERNFLDDFNSVQDAKTKYPNASVTASEEEETKETTRSSAEQAGYNDARSGVKFRYNQSPAYNRGYERGTNEEEEEASAPANRDRSIEFQNQVDTRTKPTLKDDLKSSPNLKRMKQRYNRFKRKTYGE